MIEIKKKPGESMESLVRRFTRRIQQSRVLIQVKEARFYKSPESKKEQKKRTLRRKNIGEKKEYLRKIGQLKETAPKYRR